MGFAERRKYPRVYETVRCRLQAGSSDFAALTTNLSCGGALCELPDKLPEMTKLAIALELPSQKSPQKIECIGVVIRQDSQAAAGKPNIYLTAIYFSEISPENRRRIAEFVLESMLSHDRRRP